MPKIDEMFAFVSYSKDDPEDEGVIAFESPGHSWIPMVGADMDRVESLKPLAKEIMQKTGILCKLKRFILISEEDVE